jgi:hypothetical protein
MLDDRAPVTGRTFGCLVLLAAVTAVTTTIALAARPSKANDDAGAAKKPAAAAPARRGPYVLDWQRKEPTTGIPLQLLFVIMDSVEGQKELNLTEDQKLKAKYARLSTLLGRGADPQEYQSEAHQEKVDDAAKALIALLTPKQVTRLRQIGLQMKGLPALTTPEVVSALTVTEEQAKKLRELESKFRDRTAKLSEQLRAVSTDRSLSQKERRAKMSPLQKELREMRDEWERAALAILTPPQREKFEKMKGATFDPTSFHSVPRNTAWKWLERLDLLRRLPAVQQDLKLTDAQQEKLGETWKRFRLPTRPTPLEREKTMDEMAKAVERILLPAQAARLRQIHLQWLLVVLPPASVLMRPEITATLHITESQQKELQELGSRSKQKRASLTAKGSTPEESNRKRQQLSKEETEQALRILNPEQREKFQAMKGPEFDWSAGF